MLLDKKLLHTTDIYIKKLNEAWIEKIEDFIEHYPRTYENKSNNLEYFSFVNIKEKNSILCTIESIVSERTKNGKNITKAIIKDKWWFLSEAVWFNKNYILSQCKIWDKIKIFGKPQYNYGKLSFPSPEIEFLGNNKEIKPIYPEINYIPSDWFEKKIELVKPFFKEVKNTLPEKLRLKKWFKTKNENLTKIHFPKNPKDWEEARFELAYEELYRMQYEWLSKKKKLENETEWKSPHISLNPELIKEIISHIPFSLTNNQKIVIFQILKDIEKKHSMRRLLQWDVGTGKTIVALIVALHCIVEARIQVAIMVPTEILARQHFLSMQSLLTKYNIRSELLIWSITQKQKDEIKTKLKLGEIDLVIWTHAIIQDWVFFKNLWFVVIDEQHRFGVEQRWILENMTTSVIEERFKVPHVLNMTATPIPRSLALTIYGDQDISVINEYPAWRKNIYTKVIKETDRNKVYNFIEEEVKSWRQVYWISPLVSESETLDIASATQMYETLTYIFPSFRVWLLHGKIKAKEKEEIMGNFMSNEIQILSSTSVIEVWVNNPNATIICIEASERFGLSQLHQFRWRVGRWHDQSYCYLFTTKEYKWERLKAMEKTNDGFELSEIDLELRWPGEVYGIKQSWIPDFKIANLKDFELIAEIREDILEEMKMEGDKM